LIAGRLKENWYLWFEISLPGVPLTRNKRDLIPLLINLAAAIIKKTGFLPVCISYYFHIQLHNQPAPKVLFSRKCGIISCPLGKTKA